MGGQGADKGEVHVLATHGDGGCQEAAGQGKKISPSKKILPVKKKLSPPKKTPFWVYSIKKSLPKSFFV